MEYSVTLSFDANTEKKHIAPSLHMRRDNLRQFRSCLCRISLTPNNQIQITEEEYNKYVGKIMKIDFTPIYEGEESFDAEGDRYCTTDVCEMPQITTSDIADML